MLSEISKYLSYNPENGVFTWVGVPLHGKKELLGTRAGTVHKHGYRVIRLHGKQHRAARLAWLFSNGEWPINTIDHKNGNRDDDRIENLREATKAEQNQNIVRSENSSTGIQGVYFNSGKWRVMIGVSRKLVWLGSYDSKDEAIEARKAGKAKYHPFQPEQR